MLEYSIPKWVSCFCKKRELYASDKHFLNAWSVLRSEFEGECLKKYLWNLGLLLVKPEAVSSDKGHIILNTLKNNSYNILGAHKINVDRVQVHALWKYALGRYSDERFELLSRLMHSGPSILLVLGHQKTDAKLPLSVRLTDFKGETAPAERRIGTLRAEISDLQSVFLNYIHTSDEPCDVVRELDILLDQSTLKNLASRLKQDSGESSKDELDRIMNVEAPIALNDAACKARLLEAFSSSASLVRKDMIQKTMLYERIERCFAGCSDSCSLVQDDVDDLQLDLLDIDRILLHSKAIPMKRKVKKQAFPSCELQHWLENNENLNG